MKIAVAVTEGKVAGHFGGCDSFEIFDVQNDEIKSSDSFDNPGHKPGFLPNFLEEKGASAVIAGGMGEGAVNLFAQKGIETVTGVSGDIREAISKYVKGELKSKGAVCHEHKHMHGEHCCG